MRIAILGWGSLYWDHDSKFDRQHRGWYEGHGPGIKLEFSQIVPEKDDGLALVIDPHAGQPCRVGHCFVDAVWRRTPEQGRDSRPSRHSSQIALNDFLKRPTMMFIGALESIRQSILTVYTARARNDEIVFFFFRNLIVPGLLPDVDPQGLLEYSVVFTDRALNHMSQAFQGAINHISATLKRVYKARSAVVVPGSGTFGMEAVARQFATGKKCMVIRNGWFSFRWSQILEMGAIPSETIVLKARRRSEGRQVPFAPPPIDEVVASIRSHKPEVVFAPHVETGSGIILPDAYMRAIAEAVHSAGGLFVVDCIASGTIWVDMVADGVDILISAPQKGWSATPCCALVMLSNDARKRIDSTTSTSFACDLRKWLQIMEAYENGGYAYHATMPTDALIRLRNAMQEIEAVGFDVLHAQQRELGAKVRALLAHHGYKSVAAEGFEAPGVVVSYTDDPEIQSGQKFVGLGLQIAAGLPLQCDEPDDFRTFRIGLFGLDKLRNIERTVAHLDAALAKIREDAKSRHLAA